MCYHCCQGGQCVIAIELARYQCVVAVVIMINVLMLLNGKVSLGYCCSASGLSLGAACHGHPDGRETARA